MEVNAIHLGDCLEIMPHLPDNIVSTILTDPPYSINFMNKDWDNEIAFNPAVWAECLRVAKPGATLMAFGGTRTHHRLACAIEDAGWEIRDCITYFHDGSQAEQAFMGSLNDEQLAAYLELHYPNQQMSWVYGQGIGLGHNVGKGIDKSNGAEREVVGNSVRVDGRIPANEKSHRPDGLYELGIEDATNRHITAPATPLAAKFEGFNSRLKPSFEPIVLAMKPLDGTYSQNAAKWGVAGLWIDGARIPTNDDLSAVTSGIKSIHRQVFNQGARPEIYYKDHQPRLIDNSKGLGRYPANTILDGSEQVEAEFAKAGVSVSKLANRGRGLSSNGSNEGYKRPSHDNPDYQNIFGGHNDTGTASRYFQHCPPDTEPARLIYQAKAPKSERSTPGNNHPTQKPLSLLRYLCRLTRTPTGGIVLDPFAGSGTTGLACLAEGREYILIEKEPEYYELIKRRIAEYTGQEIAPIEVEVKGETVKQLGLW